MNESTFETHLAGAIEKIFPTILRKRIETQKVLTLRLGHRVFTVSKPASYATGRADVILHIDEKPTVLLELKAPDQELSDEDVSQGVSYCRLHEPMIPILVVTNGSSVRICSTFDRSPIAGESLDEARIVTIVQTRVEQSPCVETAAVSRAAW